MSSGPAPQLRSMSHGLAGGRRLGFALAVLLLASCGAKTGLLVPDASHDADVEEEPDVCRPEPVEIDRRRAEVMFTIDRSASMRWSLEGDPDPGPGVPSRWSMLREDLGETLYDVEHLIEVGAKFFPLEIGPNDSGDPERNCSLDSGIDLVPAPYNTDALLDIFDRTSPAGGTPTALGIDEARSYLVDNERTGVSQFIVLATDGGPNCNFSLSLPCTCTGDPLLCEPGTGGTYNCLDRARILDVITRTYEEQGIPVFVIGIEDPNRSDLADVLDEMAIAGGRPRSVTGERRFYSVRREGELRDALNSITGSIARCLFVVAPRHAFDPRLEVLLNGDVVAHDTTQTDGWDWTDPEAGELTLFGSTCDMAFLPDARVTARLACMD